MKAETETTINDAHDMGTGPATLHESVKSELLASADVKQDMAAHPDAIVDVALELIRALRASRKVLFCGNGGSAADAVHLAAELVGRYRQDREALSAIALSANLSTLTAIGNDYSYDLTFSRQVEALGSPGDVLVCISTSGRSANVVKAAEAARARGLRVVALTGEGGGPLAERADVTLAVPSRDTARIQEGYMTAAHAVCGLVERALCGDLRGTPLELASAR